MRGVLRVDSGSGDRSVRRQRGRRRTGGALRRDDSRACRPCRPVLLPAYECSRDYVRLLDYVSATSGRPAAALNRNGLATPDVDESSSAICAAETASFGADAPAAYIATGVPYQLMASYE